MATVTWKLTVALAFSEQVSRAVTTHPPAGELAAVGIGRVAHRRPVDSTLPGTNTVPAGIEVRERRAGRPVVPVFPTPTVYVSGPPGPPWLDRRSSSR